MKDFLDVENLVHANNVDLRANNVRELFLKYGTWNSMKKYPAPANNNEELKEISPVADLEFPIAPDFISHPPRIDPQVMLRRIQETMPWRNKQAGARELRLAQKISEEFVL